MKILRLQKLGGLCRPPALAARTAPSLSPAGQVIANGCKNAFYTGWLHRIELWKWNYSECCLGDIVVKLGRHLRNRIQNNSTSGVQAINVDFLKIFMFDRMSCQMLLNKVENHCKGNRSSSIANRSLLFPPTSQKVQENTAALSSSHEHSTVLVASTYFRWFMGIHFSRMW